MRRERAGAGGAGAGGTPAPACPACGVGLAEALRSAAMEVPTGRAMTGGTPVMALYCGGCGATLGFLPPPTRRGPPAGDEVMGEAADDGSRSHGLRPGDRVVIAEGPWGGRDGVIRALGPEGQALVEVAGFGRGRRLRVSTGALRRR